MSLDPLVTFNPKTCILGKVMRLNRMTGQIFRKHLNKFNVSNSQISILFVLSKRDGLTQKALGEFTKLEKSSVNRNIRRLLDQGHLTRSDFPLIKITEQGKTLVRNVIPDWEKAMFEIRSVIEENGELAIDQLLSKLNTSL